MTYYSQIGQDKYYIEEIAKHRRGGVFLDIGANDGLFGSNTATLELDYDIFVAGDNKDSVEVVNGLINEIEGLRPIYLGPGALAYLVEMSTPLLLNAMIRNKMKNPGIKII